MQIKTNDVHETVCAEKVKYPPKKTRTTRNIQNGKGLT